MEFLEQIKERTEYQAWFFGHYHVNRKIDEKTFCVFQQTVRIF